MTVTPANLTHNMRGAYVLFEGLLPTVIDSQVLTHVRLVREMLGLDIPVVAFACSSDVYEQSRAAFDHARQTAGGAVHLFRGVRPALPGSLVVNLGRLSAVLDTLGPISFLHSRGDYAAAVTGRLARSRALPMLWDCRGDSRAVLHERIGTVSPLQRLPMAVRAWMSQQDSKTAGQNCAAACFVSQALHELMAGYIGAKPIWVLPCLANENEFFFDHALRQRMRAQLGFGDGDPVYAYSGSLSGYQLFDNVVETFRATAQSNSAARLLVITPYVEATRQKLAHLPADRVVCKTVKNSEVNSLSQRGRFRLSFARRYGGQSRRVSDQVCRVCPGRPESHHEAIAAELRYDSARAGKLSCARGRELGFRFATCGAHGNRRGGERENGAPR